MALSTNKKKTMSKISTVKTRSSFNYTFTCNELSCLNNSMECMKVLFLPVCTPGSLSSVCSSDLLRSSAK